MQVLIRPASSLVLVQLALGAFAGQAQVQWSDAVEGYKDNQTGQVWTRFYAEVTGSWSTWAFAANQAAPYSVTITDANGNPVVFSDWRLPARAELHTAIAHGLIAELMPYGDPYSISPTSARLWTSET